jgi:hypothetical protein
MSVEDLGQRLDQVGVWLDAAEFAVLDQCGDDGPVVAAAIGTGEERTFAVERIFAPTLCLVSPKGLSDERSRRA